MSWSDSRSSTACGPSKLLRFVLRVVLFGALVWIILALLWAFLPAPTTEHDGDNGSNYATAQLRVGKTLTRVYNSDIFRVNRNHRAGFALDYELDIDNLTLTIGGTERIMPIIKQDQMIRGITEQVDVLVRTGDLDGANLPWFEFADSVLLYWWIDKGENDLLFPVDVHWTGSDGVRKMEILVAGQRGQDPILTLEMQGKDASTLIVKAPERPFSSSPSRTYPVRVAIIHIIAPTAVFVNDLLGNAFGGIIEWMVTALFAVLVIGLYGFIILAVVFSIWRCVGGPSFEVTVERVQGRLERLSQNERLQFLRIDTLQEKLDLLCQNERFKAAVDVCRNGWHPERNAARDAEQEIDVEKGESPKE